MKTHCLSLLILFKKCDQCADELTHLRYHYLCLSYKLLLILELSHLYRFFEDIHFEKQVNGFTDEVTVAYNITGSLRWNYSHMK